VFLGNFRLARILAPFDSSISAQSIVESATSTDGDYPVWPFCENEDYQASQLTQRCPGSRSPTEST